LSRKTIVLDDHPDGLPFSDAVLAGDTLYISGRLGIDPQTDFAPPEVDQELTFLFDGFERTLRAAGMSFADLVNVTVFSPDLSLFERFNVAYRERFKGEFPARAFIGSGPLLRNARFEMLGVAVRS
jgi:enamine deaminase RidA (YjgF/YER057c/UK114 family)